MITEQPQPKWRWVEKMGYPRGYTKNAAIFCVERSGRKQNCAPLHHSWICPSLGVSVYIRMRPKFQCDTSCKSSCRLTNAAKCQQYAGHGPHRISFYPRGLSKTGNTVCSFSAPKTNNRELWRVRMCVPCSLANCYVLAWTKCFGKFSVRLAQQYFRELVSLYNGFDLVCSRAPENCFWFVHLSLLRVTLHSLGVSVWFGRTGNR